MRIPNVVQKCVAYVGYQKRDGNMAFAGTAFFVQTPAAMAGKGYYHLVTANHVIAKVKEHSRDGRAFVRANLKGEGTVSVETHVSDWRGHPVDSSVDVAVILWNPVPREVEIDLAPITLDIFATQKVIQDRHIGIGDSVFMTGLFASQYGVQKNTPIVRYGNIALMPDEPIRTRLGEMRGYLVEVISLSGLSGSPVFVYGINPRLIAPGTLDREGLSYFIGLMHGHWPVVDDSLVPLSEQTNNLNSGIALVVPAFQVLEAINHPEIAAIREMTDKQDAG